MRGRWVAVLCGAIVFGAAAPAHALTAYVNYDSLVISAWSGEKNILTVQPDPTGLSAASFLIIESGNANTQVGPGCVKTAGRVIRCSLDHDYPVATLSLSLGNLADVATVSGGFYSQQVSAGYGNDRVDLSDAGSFGFGNWLDAGPGNDDFDIRNGSYDTLDCGGGADTARADAFDSLYGC